VLYALAGAALLVHAPNGFFMNWFGKLAAGAEGFEYHLLVMALAAVVVIAGSGAGSLDRRLGRQR
jgi:putative oxidoreductase